MINKAIEVGRLTKEIEIRKTQNDKSVAAFTLAVNDPFNKDHTDFINCVAWGQKADFLERYAHKGDIVGVDGRISTRSYDGKNGKVYVTEVIADNVQLIGGKKDSKEEKNEEEKWNDTTLDVNPDDLPFY